MPASVRKLRVVLVEDDLDLREGWMDVFDLLGHELKSFQGASEALAEMSLAPDADVLITDYYLPDMNGIELARRVRAQNAALPIVVLTGSREPEIMKGVMSVPGAELLYKPVNFDVLEGVLDRLCRRGAAATSPVVR
jgi:FixJ family two-component response regulator